MSDGSARHCPQCGEYKSATEFYDDGPPRPGRRKPLHRSKCRVCTRAKMRKRYEHRSRLIDDYKLERGCVDCGWRLHPRALEFDHLPGSVKVANIASMISRTQYSIEQIRAEMAKCEVVCANCHRIRTYTRECGNTGWDLRLSSRVTRTEPTEDCPEQLTLEV